MKKILLLSDTHSHIDDVILKYVQQADEVWHAGDIGDLVVTDTIKKLKTLRAVYGNIDDASVRERFPEWLEFELEGVKVLMTHIGGKPPRYAKGVKERIRASRPQLFICGHSHVCCVEVDASLNCLYMNPGAVGQQGFHQVRTLLLFDLGEGKISNLRVVELGRRGAVSQ